MNGLAVWRRLHRAGLPVALLRAISMITGE